MPLRTFLETIGYPVEWDAATRTITFEAEGDVYRIELPRQAEGIAYSYKNDEFFTRVYYEIIDGTTMVPAEAGFSLLLQTGKDRIPYRVRCDYDKLTLEIARGTRVE